MSKPADQDLGETEQLTNKEKQLDGDNVVSKSPREPCKDRGRYTLTISLLIFINILLLSLIVMTANYVFSDKKILLFRDSNICVPCTDLKLHPDDNIEGVTRVGENKTTCCMKETEQPGALIDHFADHWLKTKLSKDDRQFTRYECQDDNGGARVRPTIKLVGKKVTQAADHHNKLRWDGKADASIVLDDNTITHHKQHGFIEIKISGLYHVYSQVVFEHDINSHSPHQGPAIYQHIVVHIEAESVHGDYQRERYIMKTTNSHCLSKSNRQQITSYLGSAFQLNEGDRLAVMVHNTTEVVPIPHMNFFGAHML